MTNTAAATGPVTINSYVQTSHMHHDIIAADGRTVLVHRYQHIVTGNHYVRDYAGNGQFGAPVYAGPCEIAAKRAFVALYRKYN